MKVVAMFFTHRINSPLLQTAATMRQRFR